LIDQPEKTPEPHFWDNRIVKAVRNFTVMVVAVIGAVQAFSYYFGESDTVKLYLEGHRRQSAIVLGYAIAVYALYIWLEGTES